MCCAEASCMLKDKDVAEIMLSGCVDWLKARQNIAAINPHVIGGGVGTGGAFRHYKRLAKRYAFVGAVQRNPSRFIVNILVNEMVGRGRYELVGQFRVCFPLFAA
eukprot:Opistho-2@7996